RRRRCRAKKKAPEWGQISSALSVLWRSPDRRGFELLQFPPRKNPLAPEHAPHTARLGDTLDRALADGVVGRGVGGGVEVGGAHFPTNPASASASRRVGYPLCRAQAGHP